MIIGSHNSCTCKGRNVLACLCWKWAKTQSMSLKEQFELGVRLFDLRYKLNDIYYISHTFDTSYTLQQAMTDLVECSMNTDEYIYVRLKRDHSSYPLPSFGYTLESMKINDTRLHDYIVDNHGKKKFNLNQKPFNMKRIILYTDDSTLSEDNVLQTWFFPQLFDTIETWQCSRVEDAARLIYDKRFKNNGLPKAIFLDFSSTYPPEIATDLLWDLVKDTIISYIRRGEIDCIMINYVCSDIVRLIKNS